MEVTVQVKGLAEMDARLQELGALAGQKLVRRVLRKIAKPMYQRAVAGAQSVQRSGALAVSVSMYNRRPKGREIARVAVGSRARQKVAVHVHNAFYGRQRKGVFYGWMLEKGHRAGKNGGRVAGRPWFEPAVRASEGQAVSDFVGELAKAVRRMERRTGKSVNPDSLVPE
jgi:hypothetical protein